MIDTHAHLDACADPPEQLVERARAAGVGRIITIGCGIESCRAALAIAASEEGVHAVLGIHPHQAADAEDDAERICELRRLFDDPRAVAVGETGLDFFRDYAPHDRQRRLFNAELDLATELGKPVVIHTRAADEATLEALERFDGTVVLHCFSSPALLPTALERGWYVSFAGNVTYPKAPELREAAAQVPVDRLLAETDCPYLAPQPRRGRPNEPANVVHTLAVLAEARGDDPAELAAQIDANASAAFGLSVTAHRRGAGVVPKKSLGQHFLVDPNVLGVIGRLAELDPADVVLEIGPGQGVLTDYLAERVARVHAVELDRSLEPELRARIGAHANVGLAFGDALRLDLGALDPAPTKLVSNLPYNVATPIVAESLTGLPTVDLWCVMVQREVADRFFAVPRTKAYGAVSVLIQLAARRTGLHPVGPEAFRPRPKVESALVAFRRTPLPERFPEVRRIVTAAFAHRRKTLANSLELSGLAPRTRSVEALAAIGLGSSARAEELEPLAFVALAEALRA